MRLGFGRPKIDPPRPHNRHQALVLLWVQRGAATLQETVDSAVAVNVRCSEMRVWVQRIVELLFPLRICLIHFPDRDEGVLKHFEGQLSTLAL